MTREFKAGDEVMVRGRIAMPGVGSDPAYEVVEFMDWDDGETGTKAYVPCISIMNVPADRDLPEPNPDMQPGACVRLRGGQGPLMVVDDVPVTGSDTIRCVWFSYSGDELRSATFRADTLRVVYDRNGSRPEPAAVPTPEPTFEFPEPEADGPATWPDVVREARAVFDRSKELLARAEDKATVHYFKSAPRREHGGRAEFTIADMSAAARLWHDAKAGEVKPTWQDCDCVSCRANRGKREAMTTQATEAACALAAATGGPSLGLLEACNCSYCREAREI